MIALRQNVHQVLKPRKHRVVFPAPRSMEMTHQKFIYFCEIQIQVNSTITSVSRFDKLLIKIVNFKLIVISH